MSTAVAERPMKRTRRQKSAPRVGARLDPVTLYAWRVVDRPEARSLTHWTDDISGAFLTASAIARTMDQVPEHIVAGRAVALACQRHFRDLDRQRTAAFPYYFDVAAAQHIIDFFPEFLTLEDGSAFHLPPWLQFSYGSIYGWKCWGIDDDGRYVEDAPPEDQARHGYRRYQHGFFETSKGSGKTPSAGGVGLYGLGYDDEASPEIYSAAFDKDQASIILNDAVRMAKASPELLDEFVVDKYNIACLSNNGFFRASSSQHRSKSGPRPFYVLSDEIHEHRDGTVVTKYEAGFKNRKQPLGLKYTNSGSDRQSYCWQLHQKSLNVLDGTLVDEQWFAYVCHLDPCPECYEEGYRQPKDGCVRCDNWTDPAVWPKVAPALGIVIQRKYLQDAVDTALSVPSEYALKRRLNFCIWTETHQVWISADRWGACKASAVHASNEEALPATAGLDPSSILDLTSLVIALRIDDPPDASAPETVAIEGLDERGEHIKQVFTLNFHVELVPYFWMPRDTQNERVRNDHVPYDHWERAGKLFTTPGPAIDHQTIYDFIIHDVWKRFRLQRVGMDQNHGLLLFQQLQTQGRLGNRIVSVGQGKKLSEAFKFMEILVAKKRLWHDGHPVLAMCVANAEPQRDRLGALWIEKPEEKKRIDGVIAAAMAIHQLMTLPFKKKIEVFSV